MCDQALTWQRMLENWIVPHSKNHSVMVLQYEELQTHTRKELLKILKFLDVPYSINKLVKLQWTEPEMEEIRERKEDVFNADQLDCVNMAIKKSSETLSHHLHASHINLTVYYS